MERNGLRRFFRIVPIILISTVLLAQLIPYGHDRSNPPVADEPNWNSQETRILTQRACFNCHSNETVWPWYARIAPVSWLVLHDVLEGREHLNFSDLSNNIRTSDLSSKIREEVQEGEMPPLLYRVAHPEARLSDPEKAQLISGLMSTVAQSSPGQSNLQRAHQ